MNASDYSNRYYVNNGTVKDNKTGLIWMRCSMGQTWDGNTCIGNLNTYNWVSAQGAAITFNKGDGYAGKRDWRLPTIDELKTLVYCSSGQRNSFNEHGLGGACLGENQRPTIAQSVFPNTPRWTFWSVSPYMNRPNNAWQLHFNNGFSFYNTVINPSHVRLVRSGQ